MESRVKEWKIFVRVSLNGVQNKKKGKRQDVIASRKKMSKKEGNGGDKNFLIFNLEDSEPSNLKEM